MAGAGGQGRKAVIDEINITPLTDIFLVLLIIMMVVAPMVSQTRNDIRPPEIQSGGAVPNEGVTVEVTLEGACFVDELEVPADQLATILRDKADFAPVKKLTIRADRDTKNEIIMNIFAAAEEARFEKIMLIGEMGAAPAAEPAPEAETS